jgi:hypothetical protein
MTHQCPKCELRFTWVTELDDHCRNDHPTFQHTYPASVHNADTTPVVRVAGRRVQAKVAGSDRSSTILGTYWNER